MPAVVPVGYGRAALLFRNIASSRSQAITFGFGDDPTASPNAIATSIRGDWLANFIPAALSTQYLLYGVQVSINRGTGPLSGQNMAPSAGTGTQDVASPNVAILMTKDTEEGGRANRGRVYLPNGYTNEVSINSVGVLDSGFVTSTQTRWSGFIADLLADSLPMVILHPADGPEPTAVAGGTVQALVATQRRRLRS